MTSDCFSFFSHRQPILPIAPIFSGIFRHGWPWKWRVMPECCHLWMGRLLVPNERLHVHLWLCNFPGLITMATDWTHPVQHKPPLWLRKNGVISPLRTFSQSQLSLMIKSLFVPNWEHLVCKTCPRKSRPLLLKSAISFYGRVNR